MENQTKNVRVGILPGMLGMYNRLWPELHNQLKTLFNQLSENLKIDNLEFFISDIACTKEQVEIECKKLTDQDIDLLIVALSPYCPSGVLAPTLLKINSPLLVWPSQSMFRLEPDEYDSAVLMLNHGVHAVQDLANVLRKNNKDFGVIHGHWQQDDFRQELLCWAQAARAICAMQKSNPTQIGGHFEDMLDLQVGSDCFISKLGINNKVISLDEFYEIWTNVQEEQIEECIKSYRSSFEINGNLENDILSRAARGEIALKTIMQKYNSFAFGLNFVELCNDKRVGDPLHIAGSVLMNEGYGYAAEGDWVTASFVYAMQQAFGVASLSEIFSVSYADNRLVLKHWGEGNFNMSRNKTRLSCSEFEDVNKTKFAIVDFEFEPGRVTLINLNSTPDGHGQIISMTGLITEDSLPKVNGPRAVFKPDCEDVRKLLTNYAYDGGSHHLALINGNGTDILEKMCKLAGWVYISLSGI